MSIDFSGLFHDASKDLTGGGSVHIPADSRDWPAAWHTTYYKRYPRFKKIALPDERPSADFFELVRNRVSARDITGKPMSADVLGTLLRYSCGITGVDGVGRARRAQPSGGARYSIEAYPLVFKGSDEVSPGLYHYNVKDHALDVLWERDFSRSDIAELFTYPWVQDASCALILTAVFSRNQMKYGERGYRYILLEAGHIGQNAYLAAQALGLKCCALGGTFDIAIENLIEIDGFNESLVYALALG